MHDYFIRFFQIQNAFLTFRRPCIMIDSHNKSQRDALLSQIYLIKYSTCFRQVHCPPSGVSQHCIHAIGICHASSVGCLLAWPCILFCFKCYTVPKFCWCAVISLHSWVINFFFFVLLQKLKKKRNESHSSIF
jgi:hypothetical protein